MTRDNALMYKVRLTQDKFLTDLTSNLKTSGMSLEANCELWPNRFASVPVYQYPSVALHSEAEWEQISAARLHDLVEILPR